MEEAKIPTDTSEHGTLPQRESALVGKRVVLGISGGIAAYKAAELVRLLRKAGATVQVVMTKAAQAFITPLTLQTLSGRKVATELFDLTQESEIGHISIADSADLLMIAPATADVLAKLSLGLADDLLSTVALASAAPLLVCPAMNVNMWNKPQVQHHVAQLAAFGAYIVGPAPGELACGWVGPGRMVEPAEIVASTESILSAQQRKDLRGRWVVITAGPTYEPLDPVRFIGNRSSGKMGFALAADAAARGAEVTLIAGPVALDTPPGVHRTNVESAKEMAQAVLPLLDRSRPPDCVVMAAAVADYRPSEVATRKRKKHELGQSPAIALTENPDILRSLGQKRGKSATLLVGFAAETHDVEAYARRKLTEKGCDVIIANNVAEDGSGFGTDTNRVTILTRREEGSVEVVPLPLLSKAAVSDKIWSHLLSLLPAQPKG
ncbi:MAG: bifunctional phosphopantothenoylcysteine decarboxylase/phosphopantothenate--cysteine ligase CoaBC [Myxococcales bacterium]|nr:bifunctional phosphopantothenoylcysteine decarboxylase/phosphopantothenate--cysteine ligase CoaBC [Myxococcales bacterium]